MAQEQHLIDGGSPAEYYCRPCRKKGPALDWSISWSISSHGAARPLLAFSCPKGHPNTSFLPAWEVPLMANQPGPLYLRHIPWESIRMAADVARTTAHYYLDQRDTAIVELHRAGGPSAHIAALFKMKPTTIYQITGGGQ